MSKICGKSVQIYPKYVHLLFIICSKLLKICLKSLEKNLKKCPDSVQNQLKFRSKYVKNPSKECLKYVKKMCINMQQIVIKVFQILLLQALSRSTDKKPSASTAQQRLPRNSEYVDRLPRPCSGRRLKPAQLQSMYIASTALQRPSPQAGKITQHGSD